ncbi:MAG: RNA 2',3'-cyclic phosphodiesterase [Chloroflexi bacterium CG23_combo_of_CG06-09_8_20_14_all_45_10]|nr:MAG: RNA 2',3'-cyclic phosphodiesterase [Chloroflexi bacterium CG23_combo_of_CG06-09_8_20_14_all_45_10]
MRSFIAIELPQNVKNGLAQLRSELERAEHPFVKWVNPESIHLTLKFLGNVPFKQVAEITKAIETASKGIPPFHLEISGLGEFPNLKQPRVLWVGIKGEIDKLVSWQQNIDLALASLGFAKEERPFVPHLTLARIRQGASPKERKSFGELVMSTSFEISYPFDVEAVSLMRSQLTPAGAIYTRLFMTKLET